MKSMLSAILAFAFVLMPLWVFGQQLATINGQVTDEVGNPLPGANIYIPGTSFGAAADIEGFYSFNAPATGQEVTLTGRYMGYTPKSVTITLSPGTITQNFELNVDVLELEEVVVTGMGGMQIKRKLGMSISKVKAELVAKADESNIVQSLAGKAPNVEIVKTSGDPGTSSYIRIRGGASIDRGTQPLFVVDGVPVDNSFNSNEFGGFSGDAASSNVEYSNRAGDINSEDIESIEILKGSAASAIYGSRASNGVVLLTTKSGQPGKVKISYKSQIGISEMNKNYPLQRKWGQGSGGKASTTSSISWGPLLDTLTTPYYVGDILYYDGKTYDHSRMYSDGGYIIDNNITISGGNEMTTFFLSAGQYFEKGHWEAGSDYRRTTVRLKGTQVVTEKLKLTGNLAYSNVDAHAIQRADNLSGIGIATLRSPPNFNPKPYLHPETGLHRSYRYQSVSRTQELKRTRGFDNPYWILYEQKNPNVVNRLTGYIKAQYDLTKWITLDYHIGSDYITDDRENILPPSTSREGGVGRIMKGLIQTHEIDANFVATIRGDKFLNRWNFIDGTLMLGHNLNSRKKKEFNVGGLDMGVPEGFDQLDNTVQLVSDEYLWKRNNESFFGQMTLDLFGQLYITGAVRNDGSSTFGASQKRHWYPKASAAWEFTRFKNIPYVNFGKLRFAYGVAGIRPGVYTTISAYKAASEEVGNYTNATLGANGQYQGKSGFRHSTNLGNDNIKPERTREFEYGLDMSFYNSRIGFELTYYDQRTTDVIFDLNVAPSTGSFSQTKNAATITNKGVELSVNLTPIRHQILSWDMGLIFAANRNKVVDMSGATWEGLGGHAYAMEGEGLGIIRQQSWMRFGHGSEYDLDGDEVKENIDEYYAGQWKKNDVWVGSDGKPVMWDEPYLTPWSSNPRWTGSIRNEFTVFGNLTISALIDIVNERWMDNYGKGQLYKYGTSKDTEVRGQELPINHWLKHGEKAVGPGATNGKGVPFLIDEDWFNTLGGYSGDRYQFIEDAGYIKLREVAVSYRFKGGFIKNLGLSDVTLRLSGRNVYTKTDYTGYDPDTNRSQSTSSRGVDYFNSPQTRVWALTLRVNY